MSDNKKRFFTLFIVLVASVSMVQGQFIHPGVSHNQSDLDRMKYMVEAKIDPWYSSYVEFASHAKSSYNYTVQGSSLNTVGDKGKVTSDGRAAYQNALMWCLTGDTRHAEKAIEIFNAWVNITNVSDFCLNAGKIYMMLEGAELIKSTYSGWSMEDREAFEDMLVYPGYSNMAVPLALSSQNDSYYWRIYNGDRFRAGNQELAGLRAMLAMGIFLDNEIMYDRALRYFKGMPHRSDDLPYEPGPNIRTGMEYEDQFMIRYNVTYGDAQEDYGYDGQLVNYIYENGQCQESSRDQNHSFVGIGECATMAKIAWNQGDDVFSFADDRILLGAEFTLRYNVSWDVSYPDQPEPWEPTAESGEFIQKLNRTGRIFHKSISPYYGDGVTDRFTRGSFEEHAYYELLLGHYIDKGFKSENDALWTKRARDIKVQLNGAFEGTGFANASTGWGGLSYRLPTGCMGDAVVGFSENLPVFSVPSVVGVIESENFDYSPVGGEGRIYHDTSSTNDGVEYRIDEGVDIKVCSEGGYAVTNIEDGEWLTYTVNVPSTGTYDINIRYASSNSNGKIKFNFGGVDVTSDVTVPHGGSNSIGLTDWKDFEVASEVRLEKGVQAMKVLFSGAANTFELNNIALSLVEEEPDPINLAFAHGTATQSTNRPSDGFAPNAIDGNTSGVWNQGSVTHTSANASLDPEPWWQVDLGANYNIETIKVFNRTDCCSARLNNFTVEVIDAEGSITFTQFFATAPSNVFTIDLGKVVGRIVRISKTSSTALSLAEVEVYGVDAVLSNSKPELSNKIELYPNPVNNAFTVRNGMDSKITIYSILGRKVLTTDIKQNKQIVDVSHLNTGIYIVRVNNNGVVTTKKIVKN
ncbi:carbohydrate-binding protein [Seonamhaeicola sp. MEBiC1930]|uniref:galactose-binding domain-containing protein n=1 Tax=Seonamhaeicola sp. MEBiC01930 TaxID=2976768 RepID=UPI00324FF77A